MASMEWRDRDWRNVPGPFYATVHAYIHDAPESLFARIDWRVFLWRQPRDRAERATVQGFVDRSCNTLGSDGDAHWSLDAIRAWWSGRKLIARAWRAAGVGELGAYFEHELPAYLRAYAFALQEGRAPRDRDALPDLDVAPTIRVGPPAGRFDGAVDLYVRAEALVCSRIANGALPMWGMLGERRAENVPGLFAIAQTDVSASESAAPNNVVRDASGAFVYRQPRSASELDQVISAARLEPLFGMTITGTSPAEIRTWWRVQRDRVRAALEAAGVPAIDAYMTVELPAYLRELLHFVEEGVLREPGQPLPDLEDVTPARYWCTPRHDGRPYMRGETQAAFSSGVFEQRHPLNVPGPYYGADSDTCGTGPMEAPSNVACDGEHGQEFVFRQPRNARELGEVALAAKYETMDGHADDGNEHWTPDLVRAWWADRAAIREGWRAAGIPEVDALFESELPAYLGRYLGFLATGRVRFLPGLAPLERP